VRISNANVASENDGNEQLKWEQCFTVEVNEQRNDDVVQALYNNDCCTQEWIIDSGCSHHVTRNDSLLSELQRITRHIQ